MSGLEALLAVQELDTVADQLRHRLGSLPERARLEATLDQIAAIERETAATTEHRDAVGRDLKRFEDDVATIEARIADTDRKMYSGTVTAPRELQAMQDELKSLKRRQGVLEDGELELMEQAEPLDADLLRLSGERVAADEEATRLTAELAEAEVAIAAELEHVVARRAEDVAAVSPDLLAEYERLRGQLGGIGVARLVAKSCGGCHLSLSAVEVDRIRHAPAGTVVHCEECGRILVH